MTERKLVRKSAPAGKRRTQAERRENAEALLLTSAIKLLAERGYDGFTLAEVGEDAGFSRGLPAHYFGKKDALLAKAVRHAVDSYSDVLSQLPPSEPGFARIAAMIRQHAGIGDTQGSRALNILMAEASFRPELKQTMLALADQGMERLRREILAGQEAGTVNSGIDVETVARMIFAFLRGQMSFTIADPRHRAADVAESFLAALERLLAR